MGGRRAFSLRAGNVNRWDRQLRVADQRQELPHPIELELRAPIRHAQRALVVDPMEQKVQRGVIIADEATRGHSRIKQSLDRRPSALAPQQKLPAILPRQEKREGRTGAGYPCGPIRRERNWAETFGPATLPNRWPKAPSFRRSPHAPRVAGGSRREPATRDKGEWSLASASLQCVWVGRGAIERLHVSGSSLIGTKSKLRAKTAQAREWT
jgi:hypothetical protein